MTESDIVKLDSFGDNYFGGCYTLFLAEGLKLMTYTAHEPTLWYLIEMYRKYVESVPNEDLREQLGKRLHYMEIFSASKS